MQVVSLSKEHVQMSQPFVAIIKIGKEEYRPIQETGERGKILFEGEM